MTIAIAPTPDELPELIRRHEEDFRAAHRKMRKGDVFVFGDLNRDDFRRMAEQQMGRKVVAKVHTKASRARVRPMAVILQPPVFLDNLARAGGAQGETARELRATANNPLLKGVVPVLVTLPGGLLKATQWAAPGSPVTVVHL